MIVKMLIIFEYDPETNEYTPIKQEIVKDKPEKAPSKAQEAEDSAEPQITLESNKYILNKAACKLIGASYGDRLDIKYQPIEKGGLMFPIIGTDTAWSSKSGNKLTKSLSVSCRGAANELLAEYGDTFSLTSWKDHEGLFVLVGNKDRVQDSDILVNEEPDEDLPLNTELEDTYQIDDLSFDL